MQSGHREVVTQQDGLHQWSRWDVAAAAVGCSGGVPALSEVLADEQQSPRHYRCCHAGPPHGIQTACVGIRLPVLEAQQENYQGE